ncbi:hypothetical protein [Vibrio sp. WXL103]|uniref:hypothetical protein n=1 Tax=unclassified Vibrio TaxID=2614977 RepID=UPI003EC50476
MRKFMPLLCIVTVCVSTGVSASNLPQLPNQKAVSSHKLFVSSYTSASAYQTMSIDSGYAYSVFDNFDVYIGARLHDGDNSLLSGVGYSVTERLSIHGTLHTFKDYEQIDDDEAETTLSAELTSRLRLNENLDIHATLDYQDLQGGVEFGLGFRF